MNAKYARQIIKSYLSRIKFALNLNPIVDQGQNGIKFIPAPYKAIILISADFELAWAPRFDKQALDPLDFAIKKAKTERDNIPLILDVCNQYNIPVTWATVGHLFLSNCKTEQGIKHRYIPKVEHYQDTYWDYQGSDWFEHDPCSDFQKDPEWYAPDLIRLILDSPVHHEMACHTFSHINSRDGICPPELMTAEINECKSAAESFGVELRSFVHPGHTIGNLDVLASSGFTNFRTNDRNVLGHPKKHKNGLWELEQTMELRYYDHWSTDYQIFRYKKILKRAIETNTLCVFWFHPSFDIRFVQQIMPDVFRFMQENRDDIWVTTHKEYISWLNRNTND